MDTRETRRLFGLTQAQLSDLTGIPYRTITEWDSKNSAKDYIIRLINIYLLNLKETMDHESDAAGLPRYTLGQAAGLKEWMDEYYNYKLDELKSDRKA